MLNYPYSLLIKHLMLKNQIKKMDDINSKIEMLKKEQTEIETTIAKELVRILKTHHGFEMNFEIIAGGLIDILTTSDQEKLNSWKDEGARFLHKKRSKKSL